MTSILSMSVGAVLGLAIGSFANVVAVRWPHRRSVGGRSHCPQCHHPLAWYELIPIISWLIQRGRCRACRGAISWKYPLVEIVGGCALAGVMTMGVSSVTLTIMVIVGVLLTILFALDLHGSILPDLITLPLIVVAVISALRADLAWTSILIGGLAGACFFGAQYLVSHGRWLGNGDIRLGIVMGVLLGWRALIVAVLLGYCLGALIGVVLILTRRKQWSSALPLGAFLIPATLAAWFFGSSIIIWYQHLLGL